MKFMLALLCAITPLEDGSLVFLEHSNRIVEGYLDNPTTHVGVVVTERGKQYIYEATPPKVRRVSLMSYYEEIIKENEDRDDDKKIRVFIYRPKKPYNADEVAGMKQYLDRQLGREYSILSYLLGKVRKTTHCSEMASNALNATGRFKFQNTYRVSPVRLLELIKTTYQGTEIILVGRRPDVENSYRSFADHRCSGDSGRRELSNRPEISKYSKHSGFEDRCFEQTRPSKSQDHSGEYNQANWTKVHADSLYAYIEERIGEKTRRSNRDAAWRGYW